MEKMFTYNPPDRLKKIISRLWVLSLILLCHFQLSSQQITGKVVDVENIPLIGASILEAGTSNGTITDLDGNFTLTLTGGGDLIQVSYTGYQARDVVVIPGQPIEVILAEGISLDEVVVTALGISREKKGLTYAVDEIDSKELTTVKRANVVNSLAGKAAGVFINKSGTGVGGSARVLLRGNKSLSNNQPLYVIDGIPMTNNNTGQQDGVFGGGIDGGDGISNINPEDVESMSILKGASAAALYGSQAANGVILITTKKGKSGKPKISFSSTLISESVTAIPDLQYKYGQTSDGAEFSWGGNVNAPNHVDDFFETGVTKTNSISISGGSETMQTYASYSNTSANGIIPTNDLVRHNINLNQSAQFYDNKLKLNGSVNYINQNVKNRSSGGLYFNPLTGLYFFPRGLDFNTYKSDYELYNAERNFNTQNWIADRDIQQNPHWILNRNLNENNRNRFISSFSARYHINSWLRVQMRANVDKSLDNFDQKISASTQGTLSDANGRYILRNTDDEQIYGDLIFGVSKSINEDLTMELNAGFSHTKRSYYRVFADSKNGDLSFANKFGLQFLKNPNGGALNEALIRGKKNAAFASAQFGYKSMLYLDITGRNDWTSTLPNTSYFYPSFGATAILSEMTDISGVDFAKLRVSYAIVGNDVPAYIANGRDDRGTVSQGQLNLSGVGPIPGTELEPEESKSFEIGLDLRMLSNKLSLDLTYYKTNTINQFITISAPAGSGFTNYLVNAGDIQNKGIEGLIGYKILDNSDLSWDFSLNYTKNVNEILEVHPEFDDNGAAFFISGGAVNSYGMAIQKGGAFGDIYGILFERDEQGRILINSDGNPKAGIGGVLGNPNPDYQLGISNEINFKGVTLSFLIDGRFGGEVMSITEALLDEFGVSQRTADARDAGSVAINGVNESDGTVVSSIDAQSFYTAVGGRAGITENYIYDATNIRLREMSIGFDIPASVTNGVGFIDKARLSIIGTNLFFFKNEAPFDPDVTFSTGIGMQGVDIFSLPSTRGLGLNLLLDF